MAFRRSMKLVPRHFGPYKVIQLFGSVGYRLELPASSKIHPVFHVSCLKKKMGQQVQVQGNLPPLTKEGVLQPLPETILGRCIVKCGNRAVTEVLIEWQGVHLEDAIWERYYSILEGFPDINLEDKVATRGED